MMGSRKAVPFYLLLFIATLYYDGATGLQFNVPALYLQVAENTGINSILMTFNVSGGSNITVVCANEQTRRLVRLDKHGEDGYNVLVKGVLDREEGDRYDLKFQASDDDGNTIPKTITLYLEDVNDNAPTFQHIPYFWELNEDHGDVSKISVYDNSTFNVSATDPDQGSNGTVRYSMEPVTQSEERRQEYRKTFRINERTGVVTKMAHVDYEQNSYYQFVVFARDLGTPAMTSNTSLIIQIKDVQDKPPFYTGIPYRMSIQENIGKGMEVVTVYAQDGDPGVSNHVNYTIQPGPCTDQFSINPNNGTITTNTTIDRDTGTIKSVSGVCTLTVVAQEIPGNETQYGETNTSTNVTVMVEDVDDNVPTFNADVYNASIQENAPLDIPITMNTTNIVAYDNDTGNNARFSLTMKYANGSNCSDFEPWPNHVEGEQTIMIRARNPDILDYEKRHNFTLLLVATETANSSHECTSTISLALIDVNDNNPEFCSDKYNLTLEENTPNFTLIGRINATDLDSDTTLTYTLSGGGGSFFVNNETGEIRTLCTDCNSTFDREKRDVFYMTYVATDPGGRSDSVPLEIRLLDVNDNAPKFDRSYSASINENDETYLNKSIVRFQATDNDLAGSDNSSITYLIEAISQPVLMGNFTLNDTTGELFITKAIDYEALNGSRIIITVKASDEGSPKQSSVANVTIDVQDENDNSPKFNDNSFAGNVSEDQTSNTTYSAHVGNVAAHDDDGTAPNNQFNYFITGGSDEKFTINSTSGEVTVQLNAKLDRETKPNYTLTIMIIDKGASPKSATTEMEIQIQDVNDEKPRFINTDFVANVIENSNPGSVLIQCNATDPDLDSSLRYNITNMTAFDENGTPVGYDQIKDYFTINETSGMVSVKGNIDRETAKTVVLYVNVSDEHASPTTSPQHDSATVHITVLDVNDNPPVFANTNLTLNVSENSQTPAILTTITATDRDENRTISYTITHVYKKNTAVNPFSINNLGVLSKVGAIDREVDDVITVTVQATDSGVPPNSTKVNVTVEVVDFNDNAPRFNTSSYSNPCRVAENTTTDTILFSINATDADIGPNANITFSIDSGDHGNFTIDSFNGSVRVKNNLDRELIDQYVLYITARDNPLDSSQQKSTSTTVTIIVTDVNDNAPIFDNEDYFVAKREDTAINKTLLTVSATDKDLMNTNNSKITFEIHSVNSTEPLFRIEPQTGDIIVNMSLKDKVDTYNVTVLAIDAGIPTLNSSTDVIIEVDDVNLHAPVVTRLPSNNTIKIYECIRPNTIIHTFSYTDKDRGRNADAFFNISTVDAITSKLVADTFNVSENGELRTRVSLDVNVHNSFTFQIQAVDRGDPVLKSDKVTLKVDVIDVNDHLPNFKESEKTYIVTENQNDTAIGNVTAFDEDKDAIKCYNITGEYPTDHFVLGYQNGSLRISKALDYESNHTFHFTIKVHDCSLNQNLSDACDDVTNTATVNDTIHVHINVRDVNDNRPRFVNRQMFTGMVRRTEVNTPLKVNLKSYNYVLDEDSRVNGIEAWSFYNDGPIIASPGLNIDSESGIEACEDGIKHVFCVSKNGSILNEKYFKEDVSGYFIVPVRVNDTGGADTANITVYLIGDSQILVMTLLDTKEKVAVHRDRLLESFSNVVGYTLVYDKLEDHKTPSGQIISDQSDLHFHVVNRKTNEVLSGSDARRLLDTFSPGLTSTMKEFHVSTVDQIVQTVTAEDKSSKTMFILVAVVAVLVFSNAIFVYVFLSVRSRYKRKLLAATINTNKEKGIEMQPRSHSIPGSNKYTTARSNPLLDAQIQEHPHALYDEISLNSSNSLDANDVGEDRPVEQSKYDTLEDKEVTLDMYTEDGFTTFDEEESPLEAAIRLHDQSRELESQNMDEEGSDEEKMRYTTPQFINQAFDEEELETSEI